MKEPPGPRHIQNPVTEDVHLRDYYEQDDEHLLMLLDLKV